MMDKEWGLFTSMSIIVTHLELERWRGQTLSLSLPYVYSYAGAERVVDRCIWRSRGKTSIVSYNFRIRVAPPASYDAHPWASGASSFSRYRFQQVYDPVSSMLVVRGVLDGGARRSNREYLKRVVPSKSSQKKAISSGKCGICLT